MERWPILTDKYGRIKSAFVLDKENLHTLQEFMKDFFKSNDQQDKSNDQQKFFYVVNLSDGQRLNLKSLEEVLKINNTKKSRITSISVVTFYSSNSSFDSDISSLESSSGLSIYFSNSTKNPISYSLTKTDQEKLLYYEEKINGFCESLQPMYSFVAVSSFWTIIFLIMPSFITLFGIIYWIVNYITSDAAALVSYVMSDLYIFLLFSVAFISVFLSSIFEKIFPAGQFKIGNGIKRFEELKSFRNKFLGVLVLGFIGNLIAKVFFG